MNVEPRPHRESGEVAEQLLAADPARVGRDGLRLESLAQGEHPGLGQAAATLGSTARLGRELRFRAKAPTQGVRETNLAASVGLPNFTRPKPSPRRPDSGLKVGG